MTIRGNQEQKQTATRNLCATACRFYAKSAQFCPIFAYLIHGIRRYTMYCLPSALPADRSGCPPFHPFLATGDLSCVASQPFPLQPPPLTPIPTTTTTPGMTSLTPLGVRASVDFASPDR